MTIGNRMLDGSPLLLQASVPASAPGIALVLLFGVLLGLGRWRLPPGVAEMLFAAGLSGLLLLNTELAGVPSAGVPLASALAGLALLWAVVHRWIERPRRADTLPSNPLRRPMAVVALTLSALGTVVVLPRDDPVLTAPATLVVLAVAAVVLYSSTHSTLARDATLAILVLGTWQLVPGDALAARSLLLGGGLLLAAAVALALLVAAVLVNWRHRVHIWQTDPQRLIDPPPSRRLLTDVALVLGIGVGWGGLVVPGVWFTPLTVLCATLAVLGVGHLRSSAAIGRVGLALTAEVLVLCAVCWLPRSPARLVFGLSVAGLYLLWLARFWAQQLRGDQAWTTAGRLIPAARELGYAVAGLASAAAWAWRVDALAWEHHGYAQAIAAGAALLVLMSMLFKEADTQRSSAAATAGWLALLGAVVAAQAVLHQADVTVPTAAALAAASLVGALRSGRGCEPAGPLWVHDAWIGGGLPLAVLCALLLTGTLRSPEGLLALAGTVAALFVRFVARSSRPAPLRTG